MDVTVSAATTNATATTAAKLHTTPQLQRAAEAAPPDHGYAKFITSDGEHVMRAQRLAIGRDMGAGNNKPGTFPISAAKNVSRIHAELYYQPHPQHPLDKPGHWVMTCLGKNGLYHNGVYRAANQRFMISHRDQIKIGDTVAFFLEPEPNDRE